MMLRRTPLQRRTGLRAESPRTVEQRAVWQAVQQAALIRDGYRCKGDALGQPHRGRLHVHHIEARSQAPAKRHLLTNLVCLCAGCHRFCHEHPLEARAAGLIA